ncbi:MAG: multifunctional CCA addition/repair protein [Proteobacteria bacterium]|jgi:tRNA nucleotidyltransferase (CCA-adding enzyme)|nr:multifunctional CCA addition/repair protein [Pseudomonadota bacterium]
MEVYLVGGAVRDEQLGLPVKERDWCVVGATPDELLSKGYRQVGKGFPVFLHPETNEEYALARTERKTGAGYHGFEFQTSPDVTLEADLSRRDLTINAMARDADANLIDPFDGMADLEHRVLRHISDAFSEDPVRILRTAKFKARFAGLGFELAGETLDLMAQMVSDGEADSLQADRVWQETEAALAGPNPHLYFQVLRDCGALAVVFPELDALFGVPQPPQWHPEIDCGLHALMVLEQSAKLSDDIAVRFAALVHDLGKATTAKENLPSHPGHERRSVTLVNKMSKRLPVPRACRELGVLVAEYHAHCHRAFELRPQTILKLLKEIDAFRRPERFRKFLLACEADARGRTGFEDKPYPQAAYLERAGKEAGRVKADQAADTATNGAAIGADIDKKRLEAIKKVKAETAQQVP